jgi:hypothetical protein
MLSGIFSKLLVPIPLMSAKFEKEHYPLGALKPTLLPPTDDQVLASLQRLQESKRLPLMDLGVDSISLEDESGEEEDGEGDETEAAGEGDSESDNESGTHPLNRLRKAACEVVWTQYIMHATDVELQGIINSGFWFGRKHYNPC